MSPQPENQPVQSPKLPLSLNLRISLMLISLFSSLLLWMTYLFPPIFIGLFFSSFVSLFFYEVLGIVDPEDSLGFDVNFSSQGKGVKLTAQLLGSIAVFGLTWVASTWNLDKYVDEHTRPDPNAELDINNKVKNQEYVYIILKPPLRNGENGKEKYTQIGRLNVVSKLQAVYKLDPFDPIIVRIRNECTAREGLCTLPQDWFEVEVVGENSQLKGNTVSVCKGHDYLADQPINLSNQKSNVPWRDVKSIGQGISPEQQGLQAIDQNTFIKVSKYVDRFCPSSSQSLYPRLRISPELKKPLLNMLGKDKKVYARTIE